jgi:hypothetical protein
MICIYRSTGPTDAWLVRDWLERNGVRASVQGQVSSGLLGSLPMIEAWPTVWVDPADEPAAREALARFEGPQLVHPEWRCPRCGESNGPAFGACWQCGADGPG